MSKNRVCHGVTTVVDGAHEDQSTPRHSHQTTKFLKRVVQHCPRYAGTPRENFRECTALKWSVRRHRVQSHDLPCFWTRQKHPVEKAWPGCVKGVHYLLHENISELEGHHTVRSGQAVDRPSCFPSLDPCHQQARISRSDLYRFFRAVFPRNP
jgi:hypothetical protein